MRIWYNALWDDRRYAVDESKTRRELGWSAAHTFEEGIRRTVTWYVEHRGWCARTAESGYRQGRLGLGAAATAAPEGSS